MRLLLILASAILLLAPTCSSSFIGHVNGGKVKQWLDGNVIRKEETKFAMQEWNIDFPKGMPFQNINHSFMGNSLRICGSEHNNYKQPRWYFQPYGRSQGQSVVVAYGRNGYAYSTAPGFRLTNSDCLMIEKLTGDHYGWFYFAPEYRVEKQFAFLPENITHWKPVEIPKLEFSKLYRTSFHTPIVRLCMPTLAALEEGAAMWETTPGGEPLKPLGSAKFSNHWGVFNRNYKFRNTRWYNSQTMLLNGCFEFHRNFLTSGRYIVLSFSSDPNFKVNMRRIIWQVFESKESVPADYVTRLGEMGMMAKPGYTDFTNLNGYLDIRMWTTYVGDPKTIVDVSYQVGKPVTFCPKNIEMGDFIVEVHYRYLPWYMPESDNYQKSVHFATLRRYLRELTIITYGITIDVDTNCVTIKNPGIDTAGLYTVGSPFNKNTEGFRLLPKADFNLSSVATDELQTLLVDRVGHFVIPPWLCPNLFFQLHPGKVAVHFEDPVTGTKREIYHRYHRLCLFDNCGNYRYQWDDKYVNVPDHTACFRPTKIDWLSYTNITVSMEHPYLGHVRKTWRPLLKSDVHKPTTTTTTTTTTPATETTVTSAPEPTTATFGEDSYFTSVPEQTTEEGEPIDSEDGDGPDENPEDPFEGSAEEEEPGRGPEGQEAQHAREPEDEEEDPEDVSEKFSNALKPKKKRSVCLGCWSFLNQFNTKFEKWGNEVHLVGGNTEDPLIYVGQTDFGQCTIVWFDVRDDPIVMIGSGDITWYGKHTPEGNYIASRNGHLSIKHLTEEGLYRAVRICANETHGMIFYNKVIGVDVLYGTSTVRAFSFDYETPAHIDTSRQLVNISVRVNDEGEPTCFQERRCTVQPESGNVVLNFVDWQDYGVWVLTFHYSDGSTYKTALPLVIIPDPHCFSVTVTDPDEYINPGWNYSRGGFLMWAKKIGGEDEPSYQSMCRVKGGYSKHVDSPTDVDCAFNGAMKPKTCGVYMAIEASASGHHGLNTIRAYFVRCNKTIPHSFSSCPATTSWKKPNTWVKPKFLTTTAFHRFYWMYKIGDSDKVEQLCFGSNGSISWEKPDANLTCFVSGYMKAGERYIGDMYSLTLNFKNRSEAVYLEHHVVAPEVRRARRDVLRASENQDTVQVSEFSITFIFNVSDERNFTGFIDKITLMINTSGIPKTARDGREMFESLVGSEPSVQHPPIMVIPFTNVFNSTVSIVFALFFLLLVIAFIWFYCVRKIRKSRINANNDDYDLKKPIYNPTCTKI